MALPLLAAAAVFVTEYALDILVATSIIILLPKPEIKLPEWDWHGGEAALSEQIEDILGQIEAVQVKSDKLAKTKENCRGCEPPDCVPPVGSKCIAAHFDHPHYPCNGHVHVLLRMKSPYPECRCFWDKKGKKNVVCIPDGVARGALMGELSQYSQCPSELAELR